jgi:hypothetical protein
MTNVIWDMHFYPNHAPGVTNQTTFNNDVLSLIASNQAAHSADGVMPVFVGEYGPSISGGTWDSNYNTGIYGIQQGVASATCGNTGYEWSGNQTTENYGSSDQTSAVPSSQGARMPLWAWGRELATYISTGVTNPF